MNTNIESFEIIGLYGHVNYSIQFVENKLILVGENGTGKSTVITLLYLLITKQWVRLDKYSFQKLVITINQNEHAFTKEDIVSLHGLPQSKHALYYEILKAVKRAGISPESAFNNPAIIRNVLKDTEIDLPWPILQRELSRFLKHDLLDPEVASQTQALGQKVEKFNQDLNVNVLFLPTYRRIEQDLQAIFPGLERDLEKYSRSDAIHSKKRNLELVEFGMEDVKVMIKKTLSQLDSNFRASLEELTNGYLRVILRKEYEETDISILKEINPETLDEILQKIGKSIFDEQDQKSLRSTIEKFSEQIPRSDIDKLSAHIIGKLVALHRDEYVREERVRTYADVCNSYLKDKRFIFYDNKFALPIMSEYSDPISHVSKPHEIELSLLSSGEKQIVSLFAHLYLSEHNDYFIIIDEPELSLSVPWQKKFLPDIVNSNKCKGLLAVTHSPFIYDNELNSFTHSIKEFRQ